MTIIDGYRIEQHEVNMIKHRKIHAYSFSDSNIIFKKFLQQSFTNHLTVKNLFDHEIRYPTTKSNDWIDKGYVGFGHSFYVNMYFNF